MSGTTPFQNPATARTAGGCDSAGGLPRPPAFILLYLQPLGLPSILGENRAPTAVTDFRHAATTRAANLLWWSTDVTLSHSSRSGSHGQTEAVSLPSGRRHSLCQRRRNPGIERKCIFSLCASANRPPKVCPGFCPELQPAYSGTPCLRGYIILGRRALRPPVLTFIAY